jgi:hypothetical protein
MGVSWAYGLATTTPTSRGSWQWWGWLRGGQSSSSIVKSLPKIVLVSNKEMKKEKNLPVAQETSTSLGPFLVSPPRHALCRRRRRPCHYPSSPSPSLSSGVVVLSRCSQVPPREQLLAVAVGCCGGGGGGGDCCCCHRRRRSHIVVSKLKPVDNKNKVS